MKILPPSQINNLPILEEVLEELRLNVVDHIYEIAEALNLYALSSLELKQKLNLIGFSSISIGKFISLDINSKEFEYISPEFYKMYRKLNQHRGNKMSMDYIFHSAGMMNTLVHSNTQFYKQNDIFGDTVSFFDFDTFRDNQFPELGVGDGYIIVPYTSNRLQVLKTYLATNPIIFNFLPAGYTFIFLSEYRNSYNTGALQFDNFLNYKDDDSDICYYVNPNTKEKEVKHTGDTVFVETDPETGVDVYRVIPYYNKPLYWEAMDFNFVREDIIIDDDNSFPYYHPVFDYDPLVWRDTGIPFTQISHSRFTDDTIHQIPLPYLNPETNAPFQNLDDYLAYYSMLLNQDVLDKAQQGYEAVLNNTLFYKDIWLGDYLLSTIKGGGWYPEWYDHVKGLKAIQAPTYSFASLTNRGESLASQYLQREQKVVSKADSLIQQNKREIIADRRETDLFKFSFVADYTVWIIYADDLSMARSLLELVLDIDSNNIEYILSNMPCAITKAMLYSEAESFYNQLIHDLVSTEVIFAVKDWSGNIVLTNASGHNTHVELLNADNVVGSDTTSLQSVEASVNFTLGQDTLYLGSTSYTLPYIDIE